MTITYKHYPQPVIVGTELTGLLISIALSQAQIAHTLIGEPLADHLPRTGQILTPVSTPIFAENFPELAHFAYPKKQRTVHMGDYYMQLDFSHPMIAPLWSALSALHGPQFTYPWNLDRVAADKALFAKAVTAPFCQHIQREVAAVEHDQATDRIRLVTLVDGTQIPTSHLFDATGHERFLGRQLDLPCRSLGAPQQIVHAIYELPDRQHDQRSPAFEMPTADWYQHRASVVSLYQERDGINGLALCIPLGDHVSIHINNAVGGNPFSAEQLLAMARKVLNRYGIQYQDYFPRLTQQGSATQEQYVYNRAFGTNWLLTGSAYSNTLVTIAANTDTYFAAFYMGVNFLRAAQTVGAIYQKYVDYFLIMQEVWQWGITHAPEDATKEQIRHYLDRYVWANQTQYSQFLQLKYYDNPLRPGLKLLSRVGDNELFSRLSMGYASVNQYQA